MTCHCRSMPQQVFDLAFKTFLQVRFSGNDRSLPYILRIHLSQSVFNLRGFVFGLPQIENELPQIENELP
jgi:hypothetical protein